MEHQAELSAAFSQSAQQGHGIRASGNAHGQPHARLQQRRVDARESVWPSCAAHFKIIVCLQARLDSGIPVADITQPASPQNNAVVYSTRYASICDSSRCGSGHPDGRAAAQAVSSPRRPAHPDPFAARVCRGRAGHRDFCCRAQDRDGARSGAGCRVRICAIGCTWSRAATTGRSRSPMRWRRLPPRLTTLCWCTTPCGR